MEIEGCSYVDQGDGEVLDRPDIDFTCKICCFDEEATVQLQDFEHRLRKVESLGFKEKGYNLKTETDFFFLSAAIILGAKSSIHARMGENIDLAFRFIN